MGEKTESSVEGLVISKGYNECHLIEYLSSCVPITLFFYTYLMVFFIFVLNSNGSCQSVQVIEKRSETA